MSESTDVGAFQTLSLIVLLAAACVFAVGDGSFHFSSAAESNNLREPRLGISPNRFQVNTPTPFVMNGVNTSWNSLTIPHVSGGQDAYITNFQISGQTIRGTFYPGRSLGDLTIKENADPASATVAVVEEIDTVVVFDGDSLTSGYMGSGDNTPHATRLAVTLEGLGNTAAGYNTGVGGQTIKAMTSRLADNAAKFYQQGKLNVLVVQGGHNSIADGAKADQVYADWKGYLTTAKHLHPGWRVVLETELPAANPEVYPADFDDTRNEGNRLLRQSAPALGVCQIADVAADYWIGWNDQEYDLTFFNRDRTHLTNAGYRRMGLVDLKAVRAAMRGCLATPQSQAQSR